jgi:hypothetical protein
MTILHAHSANDNHHKAEPDRLTAALEEIQSRLLTNGSSFSECEAGLLAAANEAVRRCLQAELQRRADELPQNLRIGSFEYRRHQSGNCKYYSLCGELRVRRHTYRRCGEHNGPTVVPVELDAGLIEKCTPAFAYAVARGYAKAPIRIVEQELRAAHRIPPCRATLHRRARALGKAIRVQSERLESVVRQQEVVPVGAVAINLGLDRTTIPMEEAVAEGDWPRRGGRNVTVRYRMAYVGTLTFTDQDGEPLVTRRYAVPAHRGSAGILRSLLADLRRALAQRPTLHVGVVQDNAPELWNVMRAALRADPVMRHRKWRETVDWYHLMQYLARVLAVLIRCPSERAQLLGSWRAALLRSDRAVHTIVQWIDQWLGLDSKSRKFRALVRVHGIYLVYTRHFRYASLASLGLYAGSGVTEGACKSLIKMRANRSGQRWTRKGVDGVLAIASLLQSDRLDAAWPHFERHYRATCIAA